MYCVRETGTAAGYLSFSGWSNDSGCSATSPTCSTPSHAGRVRVECQNITLCAFGGYTDWSNTASCSAVSPGCSNGAVQRQCQTAYNFREED
jgi:hypothetical protein